MKRKSARESGPRDCDLFKKSLIIIVLIGGVFFFILPDLIGRTMNRVSAAESATVDAATQNFHDQLFTADLHADSLLWNRNLHQRGSYGHIDLPRMLDVRHGLQVFSTVTKTPRFLNFKRNDASSDNITLLAIAQRWPINTWTSLTQRALHQASRLHRLSARSNGHFVIVQSRQDLTDYLASRKADVAITAGLLAIEGLHALEADGDNLRRLYNAGYRMMGLTHFFDNAIGGSAHGIDKGGLTEFGYQTIASMERLGIVVDLAHASEQLITDVLAVATRAVVVSHTGVKGTCDRTRNLSDEQVRSIASNGGLIGIAFFDEAVCGTEVDSIVIALRYTVNLVGVAHVALGSDFDGAVTTPFDVTGLPHLTVALLKSGFSRQEVEAIMGKNIVRLLRQALPKQSMDLCSESPLARDSP